MKELLRQDTAGPKLSFMERIEILEIDNKLKSKQILLLQARTKELEKIVIKLNG